MSRLGGGPGRGSVTVDGSVRIRAPTGPFVITNTSATDVASDPLATPLADRVSLAITNLDGTNSVFFGNADVTDSGATRGREIGPNEDFNIDLDDSNAFFLVTSAGKTAAVNIIEIAST